MNDGFNEAMRRLLALPVQASTVAREIDALHYFVIGVTMAGATGVFVAAAWFLARYRRRGKAAPTPEVVAPVWLEALFIGSLLGLFLLWWHIGFRQFLHLGAPPAGSLEVYVTAKQWMWKFAWPDGRASVGILYVPVGRPVKLTLTSRDVIHSLYVPAFRIKQDVVPGRYTVAWFEANRPGRYPLYCTELCGAGHAVMRADVVALRPQDYDAWVDGGGPTPPGVPEALAQQWPVEAGQLAVADLATQGREAAARLGCLACHSTDGTPHVGPTWAGLLGRRARMADGEVVVADVAYVTESIMDPRARVVEGYAPVMPTYQGRIEPAETAAIVEFIRTLDPGRRRDGGHRRGLEADPGGGGPGR